MIQKLDGLRRHGDAGRHAPEGAHLVAECIRTGEDRGLRVDHRYLRAMAAPGGTGRSGRSRPASRARTPRGTTTSCVGGCCGRCPTGCTSWGAGRPSERNMMTLNWATQVSFEPKLLGIGVEKPALTHRLIADRGFAQHGVPGGPAIVPEVHQARRRRPRRRDAQRRPRPRRAYGAPILTQAVAWIAAEVRHTVDCGATASSSARSSTAPSPRRRTRRCSAWRTPA